LIATGVEGGFDAVTCSTAGDYPSIGCSQWEGPRADDLLSRIDGGGYYIGRSYSDIEANGELGALSALLATYSGQQAQLAKLSEDCLDYVDSLQTVESLDQSRCLIYAGMWCPTSTSVVTAFCQRRQDRGYDLRSLDELANTFRDEYATAAGCEDYAEGYANRADATYDYVANLDLGQYGE
jgi:hypothetical protein